MCRNISQLRRFAIESLQLFQIDIFVENALKVLLVQNVGNFILHFDAFVSLFEHRLFFFAQRCQLAKVKVVFILTLPNLALNVVYVFVLVPRHTLLQLPVRLHLQLSLKHNEHYLF